MPSTKKHSSVSFFWLWMVWVMVITYIDNVSMLCVNSDSFVLLSADVIACVMIYFFVCICFCLVYLQVNFVFCALCRSLLSCLWKIIACNGSLFVSDWLLLSICYSVGYIRVVCSVLCVCFILFWSSLGWSGSSPFTR
jgi:hypothetical protein